MPQVDLDTLVSTSSGGISDQKIASETLSDYEDKLPNLPQIKVVHAGQQTNINELPPDFPPESFWLSKDAELDWMDQNAFLERKESTKGITAHLPTGNTTGSNSTSTRFTLNFPSKAAIIGLPKAQKASYVDAKRRNASKPGSTRLFPKKSGSKPGGSVTEPSSPKVSCMGRVRSKRRTRRSGETGVVKEKKKKTGWLVKIFRGGKSNRNPVQKQEEIVMQRLPVEEVGRKSLSGSRRAREFTISTEPASEPVGLGGMKRFASGRRSTDEYDGIVAGSLS